MTGGAWRAWLEERYGREDVGRKVAIIAAALDALPAGQASRARVATVPGRIEVFGKHTDYAGGRSLLCAASHAICSAFAPRDDRVLNVIDVAHGLRVELPVRGDLDVEFPDWRRYPATVARRLARNFPSLARGADLAFGSQIPRAAGMSSSSALIVTVLLALAEVNEIASDPEHGTALRAPLDLASYAACIENGASFLGLRGDSGVGTAGGSQDHTAMFCGRRGHAVQCAFVPPRVECAVRVPRGVSWAIGVSGIRAEKTGAAKDAYNAASRRARLLLDAWRRHTGRRDASVAAALDAMPDALGRLREIAAVEDGRGAPDLVARLEQFALETRDLVPRATEALASGDWAELDALARRSHVAASVGLRNQVPETDALATAAREAGALAASPFGAGFGGSVWALTREEDAPRFVQRWAATYRARCPHVAAESSFFVTEAGPPVGIG